VNLARKALAHVNSDEEESPDDPMSTEMRRMSRVVDLPLGLSGQNASHFIAE
jgi:hypothetical protein